MSKLGTTIETGLMIYDLQKLIPIINIFNPEKTINLTHIFNDITNYKNYIPNYIYSHILFIFPQLIIFFIFLFSSFFVCFIKICQRCCVCCDDTCMCCGNKCRITKNWIGKFIFGVFFIASIVIGFFICINFYTIIVSNLDIDTKINDINIYLNKIVNNITLYTNDTNIIEFKNNLINTTINLKNNITLYIFCGLITIMTIMFIFFIMNIINSINILCKSVYKIIKCLLCLLYPIILILLIIYPILMFGVALMYESNNIIHKSFFYEKIKNLFNVEIINKIFLNNITDFYVYEYTKDPFLIYNISILSKNDKYIFSSFINIITDNILLGMVSFMTYFNYYIICMMIMVLILLFEAKFWQSIEKYNLLSIYDY